MDPAKLKVVELRHELSQRGLDAKGNKAMLVERLRKALEEEGSKDKVPSDVTDMEDPASTDDSEKTELTKSPQQPKTSGRSSRSSSVTTPAKISTRNAPKTTVTSPIKRSVGKTEYLEKPVVVLKPLSDAARTESVITRNVEVMCETEQNKPEYCPSENEICNSTPEETQELSKDSDYMDYDKNKLDSSDTTDIHEDIKPEASEDNKQDNQCSVKSENPEDTSAYNAHTLSKTSDQHMASEMDVKDEHSVCQIVQNDQDTKSINRAEDIKKTLDQNDDATKMAVCEDVQENVKKDMVECETMEYEDKISENVHIPEVKEFVDDTIISSNDKTDKSVVEQESCLSDTKVEDTTSTVDSEENTNKGREYTETPTFEKQDVQMKDMKDDKEIKVGSNDTTSQHQSDRKRKRSASPAEDCQETPMILNAEDEPAFNDSVVTLSWYDSDLNLVIDKEGFCAATPLHMDGFCYMWAGARASYGYITGKVYYEAKITEYCPVTVQGQKSVHVLRVGWSASHTSTLLGEEKLSYGYESTGKKCTDNCFTDYGSPFTKDDIVGCYFDATSDEHVTLSYTLNGNDLGSAFTIPKTELGERPLFPHISSRNCTFVCNFGQEAPWSETILEGYYTVGSMNTIDGSPGPQRPMKKEECEAIMMCGLPGAGKSFWVTKYITEHPEKMYNILGIKNVIDKITDTGVSCREIYQDHWHVLLDKCARSLDKLVELAPTRRRNYILDQSNVSVAQRRKMKNFSGFQRKAIVLMPSEEEYKSRLSKHKTIEGKEISDSTLMELKANFTAPAVGELFDSVEWVGLNREEGAKLLERYNKDGKAAEHCQQPPSKRPRSDKTEGNRDHRESRSNRDHRDSRDYRDRRNNYPERNRYPIWRGGSSRGGWRDMKPQGHARHGPNYGPSGGGWRGGRGMPIPSHRGIDRRGANDRRTGSDRNRSVAPRQGGWGPMNSNYQGSQSNWVNQQGSWQSAQPQQGWGQQGGGGGGGWNQQHWGSAGSTGTGGGGGGGGNWKSYGQGSSSSSSSYGQNYNQQGYGNGNWNNWNQQYYGQYWGQQHHTGQTTTAGGQTVNKQ